MAVTPSTPEKFSEEVLSKEQMWFANDAMRSLADLLGVKVSKKHFEIALIGDDDDRDDSWAVRYTGESGLENLEPDSDEEPMIETIIDVRQTAYNTPEGKRIAHTGWSTPVKPVVAEGENIPTPTIYIPRDL
jgi:hypothetical protein